MPCRRALLGSLVLGAALLGVACNDVCTRHSDCTPPEICGALGHCEVPATCASLSCASEHRGCDELPNGHCTACVPGFLEDASSKLCRAPTTCAQLQCTAPLHCLEPAGTADALCSAGCGTTAVLGADNICHGCPTCVSPLAAWATGAPYFAARSSLER